MAEARYGIVVGVDGSATAHAAIEWAVADALRRDRPLTLVHAVPSPVVVTAPWPEMPLPDEAFRVLDDRTVEITLGVTRKDPSRPVVCIVRARSYDGDESGRRELLVAPSEDKTVQVTTVVQTSKPAVVGDLYGCGLDVPDYLTTG